MNITVYADIPPSTSNYVTLGLTNLYEAQGECNRICRKLRRLGYMAHAGGNGCLSTNAPEAAIKEIAGTCQ